MILVADCCRTARHALAAIARARPGVFITSVAKEIARYNTLATNAQTLNVNLQMHVLTRSKAEVLHVVEQLIATDSALSEMRDLLTDVVDIVLHCVDHNHLKQRPLSEVFPPIQTFNQVRNSRYHEQFVFRLKKNCLARDYLNDFFTRFHIVPPLDVLLLVPKMDRWLCTN